METTWARSDHQKSRLPFYSDGLLASDKPAFATSVIMKTRWRSLSMGFMISFVSSSIFPAGIKDENLNAVNANRVLKSDSALAKHIAIRKEINADQYYLFSFNASIPEHELLLSLIFDRLHVSAVHVCDKGGGVTAFFLRREFSTAEQLDQIRREGRSNLNSAIVDLPSTSPGSQRSSREKIMIPESYGFCGIEVQSTLDQLIALKARLGRVVKTVEITNTRIRKLPIHIAN